MDILPLAEHHDRKGFDCGDADLNVWFSQVARQHKVKGISVSFVAVSNAMSAEVLGFYAVSLAELLNPDLPPQYRQRLPARIPVFRLGRLAIAEKQQRQGIGEYLLFDAIDRTKRTAAEVGGVGLLVNAKPAAVGFYQRYGFEQMTDHPQNLFLPF